MSAPARRRPQFHPLTVARVEPLTDDAVAVTFDVPAELAEDYAFAPGQALTLRRVDGDRDERRSYSICAPVGAAPRVGVREVPGGYFSAWLVNDVRPGQTDRRAAALAAPSPQTCPPRPTTCSSSPGPGSPRC